MLTSFQSSSFVESKSTLQGQTDWKPITKLIFEMKYFQWNIWAKIIVSLVGYYQNTQFNDVGN